MLRIRAALLAIVCAASESIAQAPRSQPEARTVESALRLADAGRLSEARAIIDSLVRTIDSDSPELGDALFARATLAPSVLDASLDYEKIVTELPSSRWREQSLLRMAQRSIATADLARSLEYLRTLSRDYRSDSSQAAASYWMARALFEQHNVAAACAANRDAGSRAGAASPTLRAQIAEQAGAFCVSGAVAVTRDSVSMVVPAPTRPVTRGGSADPRKVYAVQVAAYATRGDAEAMAARLKKTGLDSHVDGTVKPFRVRVGRYRTYAEAAAALKELNSRKLLGFVTEMGR